MKKLITVLIVLLVSQVTFAQVNDTINFKFPEPLGYCGNTFPTHCTPPEFAAPLD